VVARRYREGSTACQSCALRRHCGGCPAVTAGQGLNPLEDLDPHCFLHAGRRLKKAAELRRHNEQLELRLSKV